MSSRARAQLLAWLFIVLGGCLYVSQYWSPSSYGVLLRQIGQSNAGLVWGEPRGIRSDEWGVVTPLTQATVRNGFERFNKTSLYQEDLRINYGLPVFDWGLIFKPTMWPYLWADPARAYSFHWYATLVLFLAGHALLFARVGLSPPLAVLLSVGVYFTPFAQFWWNEKGPVMAFFPWVILALLSAWPRPVRLLLFYWLGASWLITNFYPPLFLSLAFVGALIVFAFGREWLRPGRFAALLLAVGAAGVTAALYLKDYLLATAKTVYPGGRTVGGGYVPWYEWWVALFPFSTFSWDYESLRGHNICEVGAVGAAFVLLALCCVRYRRLSPLFTRGSAWRTPLFILVGGLLLMTAWMGLPLPSWVGAPLLWNHVQPERMEYAFGLLLMLIVALLVDQVGLDFSVRRLSLYVVLVFAGWLGLKGVGGWGGGYNELLHARSADLVVVPALLLGLAGIRWWHWRPATAAFAASALSGAVVLFSFNPIQSAQPIFAELGEAQKSVFEAERIDGGKGPVAIAGMFGATVNGLGFASVSHVTPAPALDFWRRRYPEIPEAQFMSIFNRYSHIRLSADGRGPRSDQADAVTLPMTDFWADRVQVPPLTAETPSAPQWLAQGQALDAAISAPRSGSLERLAVMIGTGNGAADGDLNVRVCQANRCASGRADLAQARDNAFVILPLDAPLAIEASRDLAIHVGPSGGQHGVALWLFAPTGPSATGLPPVTPVPRWRLDFSSVVSGS